MFAAFGGTSCKSVILQDLLKGEITKLLPFGGRPQLLVQVDRKGAAGENRRLDQLQEAFRAHALSGFGVGLVPSRWTAGGEVSQYCLQ